MPLCSCSPTSHALQVVVTRGHHKGKTGKVTQVYRRKWVIHIESLTREKANGAPVNIGIDASKVAITKLKLTQDRKNILARSGKKEDKGKVRRKRPPMTD